MGYSMNRRAFIKVGAAAAAAASLGACGHRSSSDGKSSGEGAASGGTISYAITNPTSIDPFDIEEFNGAAVASQLFDQLTVYDYETEELKPCVAESWESSDEAATWTFHIKKGLKFHDGTDVTAKSFQYGWNRLCNPNTTTAPSVVAYHLAMVKGYSDVIAGNAEELEGLSCPDDYTLRVELTEPYADFPFVVYCTPLSPIPDCAKDNFDVYSKAPVGNGPFQMDGTWNEGQYISLKRYEDYAGDNPAKCDAVHFGIYKDTVTAFREFEAGNLDLCDIPNGRVKETVEKYGQSDDGYTSSPNKQTMVGDVLYTEYLAYNVNDPILSDKRVRQAMSLAINRQNLCDTLYEGFATPAGDIVPPGIKGNDETTWQYCDYDVDKAAKLLDEAGYPAGPDGMRGIDLTIMVSSNNKTDESEILQSDWKALGINVTIDQKEYAKMLDDYIAGTFQIGFRGWTADYPIMDNFLQPLMYTGVGDNVSHYSSAEFDSKLDEARKTVDEGERVQLMHEADAIAAEDMPIIPMLHKTLAKVASNRFTNIKVNAARIPELRNVTPSK